MVVILIAVLATLLAPALSSVEGQHPETMSLLGEPLYAPSLSKGERAKAESALTSARAAYERRPNDPAAVIAFEQANLALGRVGDALEILTHGLEVNPDEPRLLLERGRSYIRIRKFEVAERDLRKASATLASAKCTLALAIYLSGDFSRAREAYASCAEPGIFAYLAERRAGAAPGTRPTASEPLPSAPPVIRLPGTVTSARKEPAQPIAANYLDAIERLLAGDTDQARERLKKIVEKNRRNDWMEPAYIAAEADYARLKKPGKRKK